MILAKSEKAINEFLRSLLGPANPHSEQARDILLMMEEELLDKRARYAVGWALKEMGNVSMIDNVLDESNDPHLPENELALKAARFALRGAGDWDRP